MVAGDDKVLEVTVTDAAGTAVDITGASIQWRLSKTVNRRPAQIAKATGGAGVEITDAAAGVFEVTLDPADTEDLRGAYYHEAEVIDADGNVSTVLTGAAEILPALIKPA